MMPLPHSGGLAVVGEDEQSRSQPLEPGGFASHASPGSTTKLPHLIELVQVLGLAFVHVKNGSTLHADEQPSPPRALPSSQPSVPRSKPSPHSGLQPVELQCQPASTVQ